jgi:hypothetical protein
MFRNPFQHGSATRGEPGDKKFLRRQRIESQWICNSDCYSLDFSKKSMQNYFLCAYHLRREGLTHSSAKRQDYSKAKRDTWFEEKILDMHVAPNFLQVYESYGLILLFTIKAFGFKHVHDSLWCRHLPTFLEGRITEWLRP